MNRVAFAGVQQSTGMPLPLFMVATFLQSFLLTAVLGFLGVLLSGKTGLGAPVLESLVYRDADDANSAVSPPSPGSKSNPVGVLAFSAVVGLLAGAVVFGVDLLFLHRIEIELIVSYFSQAALASMYFFSTSSLTYPNSMAISPNSRLSPAFWASSISCTCC
jgi:hypothetical protein